MLSIALAGVCLQATAQKGAIEGRVTNHRKHGVRSSLMLTNTQYQRRIATGNHNDYIIDSIVYGVRTDKHGNYRIDSIIPGIYYVAVSPELYDYREWWQEKVQVEAGKTEQLDVQLERKILRRKRGYE
jgi:hypothetical protein